MIQGIKLGGRATYPQVFLLLDSRLDLFYYKKFVKFRVIAFSPFGRRTSFRG